MDGQTRREKLLKMLKESETPLSGSALAKKLGVSRQIIVSDIALLRAGKQEILSTARGYLLYCPPVPRCTRCFPVSHTDEQMEDELNAIVRGNGCTVLYLQTIDDIFVQSYAELFTDGLAAVQNGETLLYRVTDAGFAPMEMEVSAP